MNFPLFFALFPWAIVRIESKTIRGAQSTMNAAEAMSKAEINFSLELYKICAKLETGSFGLSTADAFGAVSQLLSGAQGESQLQLSNALGYSWSDSAARLELRNLVRRIDNLQYYGAWLNNAIFHAYETDLEVSFVKRMEMMFGSEARKYGSWRELESGVAFYEWSEEMGLAYPHDELLPMNESLLLGSAAVFSSDFDVDSSKICYTDCSEDQECVRITAELIYGEFNYPRRHGSLYAKARYIKLPWRMKPERGEIKTYIVWPEDADDASELEPSIDESTIRGIFFNSRKRLVTVTLPRCINIESVIDLSESLQRMRLTAMFRESNDFQKIMGTRPTRVGPVLYQSEIRHESIVNAPRCADSRIPLSHVTFDLHNHPLEILEVFEDENPTILGMGRFDESRKNQR